MIAGLALRHTQSCVPWHKQFGGDADCVPARQARTALAPSCCVAARAGGNSPVPSPMNGVMVARTAQGPALPSSAMTISRVEHRRR